MKTNNQCKTQNSNLTNLQSLSLSEEEELVVVNNLPSQEEVASSLSSLLLRLEKINRPEAEVVEEEEVQLLKARL